MQGISHRLNSLIYAAKHSRVAGRMHQGSCVKMTLCTTYDSGSLYETNQLVGPCRSDGSEATQSIERSTLLQPAYIKRPLQTPLQDLACSNYQP